ncbi:CDP-2,3-bis-(O-geranylgeranyl)-sn-glycerol synthase [Halorubrum sp. JWXQ-INN 858]|uniref:CDP-2,3-bis-(O-geranylgeranyl)-sn-glycerol synthase n=1 Tax=Halorubrum sp. JWXQ-INN 858 TaxID=2690782 RepID=UPI0013575ED6|nr:CDP-2,3-bis-(O-geranylgeranyl)-sn-glycerol synthase [Halorubrum sp. JWXQ-INN 858]MWV66017.1 CDP-2,3-bis-(O-geranylgeranyl)-sn-glycerol synthase [Halorubrum sp. JWXQ-INN 858]
MIGSLVATAFWAMLPAYVPNNFAVLAGGGRPIDGGRKWNGSRVLGDGKTWRGTAVGTAAGLAIALGLNALNEPISGALGVELPAFELHAALALAFGAMLGDIGASFVKRRSGRERGAAFPGLDQLDFVVGALLSAFIVAPGWALGVFTLPVLAVILVMTPVLHVTTNVVAYKLGLKNEPW